MKKFLVLMIALLGIKAVYSQTVSTKMVVVDSNGWAKNSVNVTVFRKNSLVTFKDTQFIAYYNNDSYLVVGKRKIGDAKWITQRSQYKANITDAHNVISLMVDDDGYLHLSWGQHNIPLNYCMSVSPYSLTLTEKKSMTEQNEKSVTYPEFFKLPNSNLLFFYRTGMSGNGNLILNNYNIKTKHWVQLQQNLIDGEGKRNAYWQSVVDKKGIIHISWVWRESPDVASNHDLCYALSKDGGVTWEKSNGEKYFLPINATTAEYICRIPQKSELINQTSMNVDDNGNPFIATYFREKDSQIPQYHVIFNDGKAWHTQNLAFRKTAFSLAGGGTKKIPISRPQILLWNKKSTVIAALVYRDEERDSKVSIAINKDIFNKTNWTLQDLTDSSVGAWEPSFDTELWKNKKQLNLFVQFANQENSDTKITAITQPQSINVLECRL